MLQSTFSLPIKDDARPYQMTPRCVAYALQEPFKRELQRLKEQQILASLGVDETAEFCNSFSIVSKPNGTVCLCLDCKRLNQTLKRQVHVGKQSMIYCPN